MPYLHTIMTKFYRYFHKIMACLCLYSVIFSYSYGQNITNDKTLKIATFGQYFSVSFLQEFTEKTGIKIRLEAVNDYNDIKILADKQGEKDIPLLDGYVVRGYQADHLIKNNLVQAINAREQPNFERMAKRWRVGYYDNNRDYSMPIQWGFIGLIYDNTKRSYDSTTWSLLFNETQPIFLSPDMMSIYTQAATYLNQNICFETKEEWARLKNLLLQVSKKWTILSPELLRRYFLNGKAKVTIGTPGDAQRIRIFNDTVNYTQSGRDVMVWHDVLMQARNSSKNEQFQLFLQYIMQPSSMDAIATYQRNVSIYDTRPIRDVYKDYFTGDTANINFYLVPPCNDNVTKAYYELWAYIQQAINNRLDIAAK